MRILYEKKDDLWLSEEVGGKDLCPIGEEIRRGREEQDDGHSLSLVRGERAENPILSLWKDQDPCLHLYLLPNTISVARLSRPPPHAPFPDPPLHGK